MALERSGQKTDPICSIDPAVKALHHVYSRKCRRQKVYTEEKEDNSKDCSCILEVD